MNKKILFIVISNVLISGVYAQDQSGIATASQQYAQETAVGYQSLAAAHTEIKAATQKPKLQKIKPTVAKSAPAKALAAKQLLLAARGSSDSGIASNAVNFSKNIGVNVNERTGQASLNINAIQLPGVSQQTGITLAINKSDNDQKTYFGLDDHWQWSVDYLETDAAGKTQLHLAQGAQYQYDQDHNTLSGMRYYQLNDARLVQEQGSITLKDLADTPVIDYNWVFQGLDGTVKYFSNSGLLLAVQDKYGNSVLYGYNFDQGGNTPDIAKLTSIENAYAKVTLAYTNGQSQVVTISLPDQRQYQLNIASGNTSLSYPKLADGSILHTDIKTIYNDDDKTVTINYPNGASKEILYTTIPYLVEQNQISAVNEVRDYVAADRSHYLKTDYIYHGDDGDIANFSGYPQIQNLPQGCLNDRSADILLSCTSGGSRELAGFSYQTQVLKYSVQNNTDKKLSKTVNQYNSLHLQTAQDNYIPHGSDGWYKISEDSSQYQAASNEPVNQLSPIYQLPTTKVSASCDPANDSCTLNGEFSKNALVSEQIFSYQKGDVYSTQPISVTSEVRVDSLMQPQTKQETNYDLPGKNDFTDHHGLVESQALSACTDNSCSAGQVFETQNSLSTDHKYIQSSTLTGSNASNLNLAVGASTNTPSRTTTVQQDPLGRTTEESVTEDHPQGMSMLAVNTSDQADTSSVNTSYQQNNNEITIKETKNDDGTVTKVIDTRNGNLMQETDAQGHKTTYTYDALGRVLTENLPEHGTMSYYYQMAQQPNKLPTSFIDQGATGISAQIKQAANGLEQFKISYIVNGQTVSKEGDNYDPATDSLKQDKSNPFGDLTRITSTSYSNLQGQKIKSIDINGNVTSYQYDTANRQVEVDNPDGTKSITAYYADSNGGLKTEFSLAKNGQNGYDIGNVKVTQTNSKSQEIADYSFSNQIFNNAKDKLDSGSYAANDYSDMALVNQDVLSAVKSKAHLLTEDSSEYDNFGNVIKSVDNNGVITSYNYDNIIYTTEDDNGQKQTHYGHMIASHSSYPKDVVDDKSLQAVSAYTMNYAYDMFDNTVEKSLSYDKATPYVLGMRQYDVNDNLINESGNGIAISRVYDQNGNVTQKVLPYGAAGSSAHAMVCNQYDDVNNLVESDVYINSDSCSSKDSSKLEETLTWNYDPTTNGLLSSTKSYGAAAKIKHDPSTINYSYYKDGSLKSKTYPDGKMLSYVYNANGSVKEVIDPFGMKTELTYNLLGQIISETFIKGSNTTEVDFKYNNWGQLIERDSGNVKQVSTFNDLGLLTQISNDFKGNLVNQFSFSYYNDGNLKQKTREDHINGNVGKSVESYVYDTMDNLESYSCQNESASIGGNVNLCPHDQYGNIIASQDYTFDPFNNIKQEKSKFMPS